MRSIESLQNIYFTKNKKTKIIKTAILKELSEL